MNLTTARKISPATAQDQAAPREPAGYKAALTAAAAVLGQFPGGVYPLELAPLEPASWPGFSLANILGGARR